MMLTLSDITNLFQDIIKLVKAGATIEAQGKIIELREGMMNIQEENLALRTEVQSLKQKLLEIEKSSLPNCPRCGKPAFSLKRSEPDQIMHPVGMFRRLYECNECGFSENRLEDSSCKKSGG